MISRFQRHERHAIGIDELLLILLLVFLATSVGAVKGVTYLPDAIYKTTDPNLEPSRTSSLGVLRITLEDLVRIQFGTKPVVTVPGTPCTPNFDQSVEKVIREELGPPRGPVEIEILPRKDIPICTYLDTQVALERLAKAGVVEKRLRIGMKLEEEKR